MNNKLNISILILCCLSMLSIELHGQSLTGGIAGKVVDKNGTAIDSASVIVVQNGHVKQGAYSDENGYYSIKPITEGAYNLIVEYKNFKKTITNTVVEASKTSKLNIVLDTPGHVIRKNLANLEGRIQYNYPIGKLHYEYAEQQPSLNQNKYYFRNKNDSFYLELLLEELKDEQYKLNR